jgi:6-phosphogluconolactonase
MRFSPTKLLQGLLCTTPILVLTLAACGGGGSSNATLASAYTLGGAISASGDLTGLVLRNNGGDDLTLTANPASYVFATSVVAGKPYNVTVLTHPSSPVQRCTVDPLYASGVMPASNVTNANVSCATAYTIGVNVSGLTGTGLVLQNNGGDNLLIPAAGAFTFNTPMLNSYTYNVSVLTQPHTPAQDCTPHSTGDLSVTGNMTVNISCGAVVTPPPEDRHVYAANSGSTGSNGVSTYTSTSGVLSTHTLVDSGSGPSSIAVDPASKFAYVANYNAYTISAYSITAGTGALVPLDMDPVTAGVQNTIATGTRPSSIAIHPSGKFAYVTNYSSNNVSAYSIDAAGVLASIDANGSIAGTSIATRAGPVSIAIDPSGGYAYVANSGDNSVSVYSIDTTTGALTAIPASGAFGTPTYISTGTPAPTPWSVTVDPAGTYLYVANRASTASGGNTVSIFTIGGGGGPGTLSTPSTKPTTEGLITGATPVSVAIHPAGGFAYVVNTDSNTVNVYSTTDSVGTLTYKSQAVTGNQPISISIDSTGQYAYVANYGDGTISTYSINLGTGELTEIVSSPFPAGSNPNAVTTAR